jgi:hypothetical protein
MQLFRLNHTACIPMELPQGVSHVFTPGALSVYHEQNILSVQEKVAASKHDPDGENEHPNSSCKTGVCPLPWFLFVTLVSIHQLRARPFSRGLSITLVPVHYLGVCPLPLCLSITLGPVHYTGIYLSIILQNRSLSLEAAIA